MSHTIAISGKGGSGKTTIAALMVHALIGKSPQAVLAVDADPNSCLGLTLGIEPENIVAEVREEAVAGTSKTAGTNRARSFEFGIQQAVTEAKGFDLLTMGRPEGPGCYCAANNLLRKFLDDLSKSYGFVVIDNEAGMEHLSRRTTNNIELLCIIAEATPLGAITAQRIFELANKLPISIKQIGVLWNKVQSPQQLDTIENLGFIPYDESLYETLNRGKTVFDIQEDSPAFSAIKAVLSEKLEIE
ncbi:MAG TPA: AAA family ATPase [Planctomycetes bacterium]|nr:AAA family ATPase [Planctomycetota bacterium]